MVDSILTQAEEQEKWLSDAMNVVKQQSFYMKHALDANNLKDALKHSALMLSELRTSKLSPQKYYELYMKTFDQLRYLEIFFQEENSRGRSNADLYELVQHSGNILPRLYLLCTVGSVFIKSKESPAKEILKDLVEMIKGVQHPIRGLFLRSYLTQVSKDKLPDAGSEYEGEGGTVIDAVDFLLQNFTEMNKLWVRMQHQGPAREKEKREKERSELRDLVGRNIHALSQLDGVDLEMYKTTVLPKILEQVVNCKDEIAQNYLMDCIIQVFPDEFHLQTLEIILGACSQLQSSVDIKSIMSQLIERLSNFASKQPDSLSEFIQVDAFSKLSNAVSKILENHPDISLFSIVGLYYSLLKFVIRVHNDQLDYVDQILGDLSKALEEKNLNLDMKTTKQLMSLLTLPLNQFNDVCVLLSLSNFHKVMEFLNYETNKIMAVLILQSVIKHESNIEDVEKVDSLFQLIKMIIRDKDGIPQEDIDEEDFAEEQNLVSRLIHFLSNKDANIMFEILKVCRNHLLEGGHKRIPFTIPSIVFSSLKLVRSLNVQINEESDSVTPIQIFQFLHSTIESLSSVNAELALRLYLLCAESAGDSLLESMSYDFYTQAFLLYEEEIPDSKAEISALQLIIGSLQKTNVFGTDNRDTLTHKATGYSAKLLKKSDQCRAVYACSHLFWNEKQMDGERVLVCLKRALRIANSAQQMTSASKNSQSSLILFIEMLNKYLYHFDKGNVQVTPNVIQGLLELISSELASSDPPQDHSAIAFYENTLTHIRDLKMKGGEMAERYDTIQI